MADGSSDHILPCRRSSDMVDQLDRTKIALGAVQRLFWNFSHLVTWPVRRAVMPTQVLLSRFFGPMTGCSHLAPGVVAKRRERR